MKLYIQDNQEHKLHDGTPLNDLVLVIEPKDLCGHPNTCDQLLLEGVNQWTKEMNEMSNLRMNVWDDWEKFFRDHFKKFVIPFYQERLGEIFNKKVNEDK